MLTLDIKGAFDSVLPGRLTLRLREQGWPDYLVKWVSSFATNRRIQIRIDGETTPKKVLHVAFHRGPLSPRSSLCCTLPLSSKQDAHQKNLAMLTTSLS